MATTTATTSASGDDEPCAFAKLWGQLDGAPFHRYVTALPSTLGRGTNATEGANRSPGFIDLGRSKALSREHGEGEDAGYWCLLSVRELVVV